jgi:hypothetical protein
MKKLLIAGDSFAANWQIKYNGVGWVNLLENDFEVKIIAQAGVSEYKIMKQLENQNLDDYDNIIVSHTSAYRIPIMEHPIHKNDLLHKNCDLIFSDVSEHTANSIMKTAHDFYKDIFNPEYFIFINDLIYKEIYKMSDKMIHITFFDCFYNDDVKKYESVFLNNKGNMNHLNDAGNEIMYNEIKKLL